ncbi:D-glycero-beta-D-manno-heptose 1,7-bisphosphate 7-phosphatase [Thermochromatium tepidum]|uniref:D,D-heptose 1,7-bisphosphate phosphatase n=1 Tax=Thermochromatium tepidum ATCC 43061 TaxID=316276 RepID=A0A6I6E095_THETI|nr:D-glycero-beta-D-manno-heptose 1,7-bisphosphate 7-phosphatase [Thermochromatium tepidum]QGU33284.1 D-glycero-beta-D-manno-heptose 1,7-bisphosphate 7-phosphatase [Thermochromatium tepidum ATCC 43061]
MTAQLLILDRDGVINQDSDDYIKSPDEWVPIPGSLEAIARLSHAGFRIAVATNQSGLARGLFGLETLNAIHRRLRDRVESEGGRIEMIAFCPHGPNDGCNCRKPRPGLLLEIAARFDVDLSAVPFIGDSLGDIQAARAAGARPWLVRTGKGEHTLECLHEQGQDAALCDILIYPDLNAAASALIENPDLL